MESPTGKKYGVLLCADDSEYVKKMYGGYFGVFVDMLAEEGDTWKVYRVAKGEFPEDDDEIEEFDGFVITGSCNDAHGNDPWITRLLNLIKKLDAMNKKILGICFGHQILGRAIGGKTGRSSTGWDIGVRNVQISSSSNFLTSLKIPSSLSIIECHRDEVWQLPPKAEVLARSSKTAIEMFKCGDNIMGIQGHPEYTKDILLHLINRLLQHHLIQDPLADEVKSRLENCEPDRESWKKLCSSFLKGGI